MRRLRFVFAVAAVCIALSGTGCMSGIVPSPDRPAVQDQASAGGAVQSMTSEEVYQWIYGELSSMRTEMTISARLDTETVTDAMSRLQHYHPEIFWTDGYTITTGSKETTLDFTVLSGCDDLSAMMSELEQAADKMIAAMPEGATDYEKVLYIHDSIVSSTSYDYQGADSSRNGIWGTAYGCLVNGMAVCQGYSEAFVYLMDRLGIESGMCSGVTGDGRHAWNYVKLGGEYYWLDLTWDDPDSGADDQEQQYPPAADNSNLRHTYFLINDEMLLRTRVPDDEQFFRPECSSLGYNYFVRQGCYFEDYSISELGWAMLQNADSRKVSVMYADRETYELAVRSLFEDGEIWDASEYVWMNDQINYSQDDTMFVVTIIY